METQTNIWQTPVYKTTTNVSNPSAKMPRSRKYTPEEAKARKKQQNAEYMRRKRNGQRGEQADNTSEQQDRGNTRNATITTLGTRNQFDGLREPQYLEESRDCNKDNTIATSGTIEGEGAEVTGVNERNGSEREGPDIYYRIENTENTRFEEEFGVIIDGEEDTNLLGMLEGLDLENNNYKRRGLEASKDRTGSITDGGNKDYGTNINRGINYGEEEDRDEYFFNFVDWVEDDNISVNSGNIEHRGMDDIRDHEHNGKANFTYTLRARL